MCKIFVTPYSWLTKLLNFLSPVIDLLMRAWMFYVFAWTAGLNKLSDWNSTLALFENEYNVPLLSPEMAAYAGTAGEIILPTLLLLGIFGRFSAVGLFIVNALALYSYPDLWKPEYVAGFNQHLFWGLVIAVLCVHGPGKISIDYLLHKKCSNYLY